MTDRPDQLDVQIEMECRAIRQRTNEARQRLGIPVRNYQQEETDERNARTRQTRL